MRQLMFDPHRREFHYETVACGVYGCEKRKYAIKEPIEDGHYRHVATLRVIKGGKANARKLQLSLG